jgi:hypothetical protein
MDDMPQLGKGIRPWPLLLAAAIGCAGASVPPAAPAFAPIPLAACAADPGDGLPVDQRSLVAMIAALNERRYEIYQVSPTDLTIYTKFRDVRGISVAWRVRFGADGNGELSVPETMPPQDERTYEYLQRWGIGVAGVFDRFKCLPKEQLRAWCVKAGFAF